MNNLDKRIKDLETELEILKVERDGTPEQKLKLILEREESVKVLRSSDSGYLIYTQIEIKNHVDFSLCRKSVWKLGYAIGSFKKTGENIVDVWWYRLDKN